MKEWKSMTIDELVEVFGEFCELYGAGGYTRLEAAEKLGLSDRTRIEFGFWYWENDFESIFNTDYWSRIRGLS